MPLIIPCASAATENYYENFVNETFTDKTVTNTEGWGEGEIELPRQSMSQIGLCDFPGTYDIIDVAIEGNYAYVVVEYDPYVGRLWVVNITDPSNPRKVASSSVYGSPDQICVSDGYAYISIGGRGFEIHDVRDPTGPHWVSDPDFIEVRSIEVVGKYAFIAAGSDGLYILNVSNPASPRVVGNLTGSFYAAHVFISGNTAFLSVADTPDFYYGLYTVNITDFKHPSHIGGVSTNHVGRDIIVEGGYAYVAEIGSVEVFDVSSLSSPILIGDCGDISGWSNKVVINGNWLYSASSIDGVSLFNITNPLQTTLIDQYTTTYVATSIALAGNLVFVTDRTSGLEIIRTSDVVEPSGIGNFGGSSSGIALLGNYAFLAQGSLDIIDITNPESPEQVDWYLDGSDYRDLDLEGDVAYIADANGALHSVNITDPTNITALGKDTTPGFAVDVCVVGDYAYVADLFTGVQVYNVTAPQYPTWIRTIGTTDVTNGVFASDLYLYVADGDGGLRIFDIHNPADPLQLGYIDTAGHSRGVFVEGCYAYVADEASGLQIVNITDPTNPNLVATLDMPNVTIAAYVVGDYCYLADGYSGLQVVNITNPRNPAIIASYPKPGIALSVCVAGDYAYAVGISPGLQIIEVMANRARQFASSAIAQTLTIQTDFNDTKILRATLTSFQTVLEGSSIVHYLSVNGGVNWELVTMSSEHTFQNEGNDLRWKAVLSSSHWNVSPTISSVSIIYITILNAPEPYPLLPGLNYSQPEFMWSTVTGAMNYLFQLDTVSTFDSNDLSTVTLDEIHITSSEELTNGTWYWRVAAIDYQGDLGEFSDTMTITIGTTTTITTQDRDSMILLLVLGGIVGLVVLVILVAKVKKRDA